MGLRFKNKKVKIEGMTHPKVCEDKGIHEFRATNHSFFKYTSKTSGILKRKVTMTTPLKTMFDAKRFEMTLSTINTIVIG